MPSDPRRPVIDRCRQLNHAAAPARSDRSERGGRSPRPITVSLVNDYEVVVRGLHAMLSPYPDRILVVDHEVGSTPDHLADVALFDTVGLDHVAKAPRQSSPVMSQRECEVLALLARGRSNREIAEELFLSVDTVKTYLRRLFDKLHVANRTQAALRAVEFELAPRRRHSLAAGGD